MLGKRCSYKGEIVQLRFKEWAIWYYRTTTLRTRDIKTETLGWSNCRFGAFEPSEIYCTIGCPAVWSLANNHFHTWSLRVTEPEIYISAVSSFNSMYPCQNASFPQMLCEYNSNLYLLASIEASPMMLRNDSRGERSIGERARGSTLKVVTKSLTSQTASEYNWVRRANMPESPSNPTSFHVSTSYLLFVHLWRLEKERK